MLTMIFLKIIFCVLNKFILSFTIILILGIYFFTSLVILPEEYRNQEVINPNPIHSVTIFRDEINLGESFRIDIDVVNREDFADILITSLGFPNIFNFNAIEVVENNFSQSPSFIPIGKEIGSNYTSGNLIKSTYPLIESDSRNVLPGTSFKIGLIIKPQQAGIFQINVKTIAIPHSNEYNHYPYTGMIDPQGEYVEVYKITVNP